MIMILGWAALSRLLIDQIAGLDSCLPFNELGTHDDDDDDDGDDLDDDDDAIITNVIIIMNMIHINNILKAFSSKHRTS